MLKYYAKVNRTNNLEELLIPEFKVNSIENSVVGRMLVSAIGLICFNEISALVLFGFFDWTISILLSGWTIYSMLHHEQSSVISKGFTLLWIANFLSPYFNLTYSLINIIAVFLIFLGPLFRNKHPGIYINFFWMIIAACYLLELEWLTLAMPQLIYFIYSLGPCS